MNYSFKGFVSAVAFSAVALFGFSGAASAQVVFGALEADAGTYNEPIVLGDDMVLSACGSTFSSFSGAFDLCDPPTVNDITFQWFVANNTTGAVAIFAGAVVSLTTGGALDFINTAGTYSLNLNIAAAITPINLGGGQSGTILGSTFDNDFATFVVETASVPEPESMLLLLPALFMIGRRQRRLAKLRAHSA